MRIGNSSTTRLGPWSAFDPPTPSIAGGGGTAIELEAASDIPPPCPPAPLEPSIDGAGATAAPKPPERFPLLEPVNPPGPFPSPFNEGGGGTAPRPEPPIP